MTTNPWMRRLAATAVAALLIPACKSAGVPDTLFLDTFVNAYPGTNWVEAAPTGTAIAVKDVTHGVGTTPPFESLAMTASSVSSSITTQTASSFNPAAVTFSVEMAADTASGADGIGTITIRNTITGPVASVTWNRTTSDLKLTIFGTSDQHYLTPTADLTFHRFTFSATAGGPATWTMDNGSPLISVATNFPAGPWAVELGSSFPTGTSWATFYFDNVTVTSP
jgi:hypothetical protein